MVVSLYSAGSGKGKTAVMQTIALAYGDVFHEMIELSRRLGFRVRVLEETH